MPDVVVKEIENDGKPYKPSQLNKLRRDYKRIAKDFNYPKWVHSRIDKSESEKEMIKALSEGRKAGLQYAS